MAILLKHVVQFFQKRNNIKFIENCAEFVCSIPVSDASVARTISVEENVWTDKRNPVKS